MITRTIFKTLYNKRHFLFLIIPIVLLVSVLSTRCIDKYDPNLNVNVNLLTINGSIIRGNEEQTVVITRSTPIDDTRYKAVTNCNVYVTDDKDNKFQLNELSDGKYIAKIELSFLNIGAKFKLTVETPDNNVYESGYEEIQDSPPIDSLYFQEEINYSKQINQDQNGLRLNLDLQAKEGYSGYYRWKIYETWEYRSRNETIYNELVGAIPERINDTTVIVIPIFDTYEKPDSLHYCWRNANVNELYSASTVNLQTNGTKRVPLHFVFENDQRFYFRYSCLVSQYSLNKGAYNYWQNKEVELKETGGIYFSQPSQTISNITNINNDQETVLGYFWTSSVKEKRIFSDGLISPVTRTSCEADTFYVNDYYEGPDTYGEFSMVNPKDFPIYLSLNIGDEGDTIWTTSDKSCFDCRLRGGTINRPDYW